MPGAAAAAAARAESQPHPRRPQVFRQLGRLPPVTTEEEETLYARGVLPFKTFEYPAEVHPGLRVSAGARLAGCHDVH